VEKRRFTRAPLGLALFFVQEDDPDSAFIEAIGRDISLGGMFVETAAPAPFGAAVIVHLTLPGSSVESKIAARVRWTTPEGMGVQLGSLTAREAQIITEIVRVHEEDTSRAHGACTD
jgi:type IV pilus assembly protein PilZ